MSKSESTKQLQKALLKATPELPAVTYNAAVKYGKTNFEYANITSILDAVQPVLTKYGLTLFHSMDSIEDGVIKFSATLTHAESDEFVKSYLYMRPISLSPHDCQAAFTYARRGSTVALLALRTVDNDYSEITSRGTDQDLLEHYSKLFGSAKDVNELNGYAMELAKLKLPSGKTKTELNNYYSQIKTKLGAKTNVN